MPMQKQQPDKSSLWRGDKEWSDAFEIAHRFGVTFHLSLGKTCSRFIDTRSLPFSQKCTVIVPLDQATLAGNFANLAKDFGWFESVSAARKAGWNKLVKKDVLEHSVGKRKILIDEGQKKTDVDNNYNSQTTEGPCP